MFFSKRKSNLQLIELYKLSKTFCANKIHVGARTTQDFVHFLRLVMVRAVASQNGVWGEYLINPFT